MFFGFDLGSRFVKIVYGSDFEKIRYEKIDTIQFYAKYCHKKSGKLILDFEKLSKRFKKIDRAFACGYGKHIADLKNVETITELEAHVIGACHMVKIKDFTLLDLGGQDTKVVQVKNGNMFDFIMNERCAAGSGRYLENMCRILNIKVANFGNYYRNPVELSNTCAIYGESEVISKIVEGLSSERIASGVNYSIFSRIAPELKQSRSKKVVFVGGLAYNRAIKYFIKSRLKKEVYVPKHAEFNGAFGCWLKARR
ncbi:acyl-CoA dehydratase activase [bacterium]